MPEPTRKLPIGKLLHRWEWRHDSLQQSLSLQWEPHDVWIGLYWRHTYYVHWDVHSLKLYFCFAPTLLIYLNLFFND